MLRKALTITGALLVGFHVWLFARDAWAGALADPGLLARWGAAAGLTWALWALRRRGVSLVRGRQAVAIWVLAAMLHAPAFAGSVEVPEVPLAPVMATSVVSALAGAVTATGLLLLVWLIASLRRPAPRTVSDLLQSRHARLGPLPPGALLPFAQRPPPLA